MKLVFLDSRGSWVDISAGIVKQVNSIRSSHISDVITNTRRTLYDKYWNTYSSITRGTRVDFTDGIVKQVNSVKRSSHISDVINNTRRNKYELHCHCHTMDRWLPGTFFGPEEAVGQKRTIPGYDVLVPTYHPTNHHFLLDTKTGRRGDKKNKTRDKRESNPSHHKRSHRFIDKEQTLSIDTGESTSTVLPKHTIAK